MSLPTTYTNKNDSNNSVQIGREGEYSFEEYCNRKGILFRTSTQDEDKKSHIDGYITVNDKEWSVDIKAMKRITRADPRLDVDKSMWVEKQNIWGGIGWTYSETDLISLERTTHWVIVMRKYLESLANKLVDPDTEEYYVRSASLADYRWYKRNRWNRSDGKPNDDLAARLCFSDLVKHKVPHKIWKK